MDHSHPADHTHSTFIHLECSKFSKDYRLSYLLVYLKCNYLCDLCRCELIGLVVLGEGSSSFDTDCGQRQNTVAIVASIIAGVAVLAVTCVILYNIRKRRSKAQQGRYVNVSFELIVSIIKAYCYHDCHCRED